MKIPRHSFLTELFSLSTFVFGWSFFWRSFLLVQVPYVLVLGTQKLAVQNPTVRNLTIIIVMYLSFLPWCIFANGQILRRMQAVFSVQERVSASRFLIGAKMLFAVVLCSIAWVIPAVVLNFLASLCVGAALGFLDFNFQAVTYIGQAAGYMANAVASIFLFGYLSKQVLATQLRAEGKALIIPARSLFGVSGTQERAPVVATTN